MYWAGSWHKTRYFNSNLPSRGPFRQDGQFFSFRNRILTARSWEQRVWLQGDTGELPKRCPCSRPAYKPTSRPGEERRSMQPW